MVSILFAVGSSQNSFGLENLEWIFISPSNIQLKRWLIQSYWENIIPFV